MTAGGTTILDTLDFELPLSGISVIVGPSGAGKTTVLRLCNRLSVPTAGEILYRGASLDTIDPLHLRRRVGLVFQKPVLFGGSVSENLRVAQPEASDERLVGILESVHFPIDWLDRPTDDLSGGEAQRLCLARTLLTDPETLLMDEPTASVDPALRAGLEREVLGLAEEGVAVVWVTHDRQQMHRLANHVVAMDQGKVTYSGSPSGLTDASSGPQPLEAPHD